MPDDRGARQRLIPESVTGPVNTASGTRKAAIGADLHPARVVPCVCIEGLSQLWPLGAARDGTVDHKSSDETDGWRNSFVTDGCYRAIGAHVVYDKQDWVPISMWIGARVTGHDCRFVQAYERSIFNELDMSQKAPPPWD